MGNREELQVLLAERLQEAKKNRERSVAEVEARGAHAHMPSMAEIIAEEMAGLVWGLTSELKIPIRLTVHVTTREKGSRRDGGVGLWLNRAKKFPVLQHDDLWSAVHVMQNREGWSDRACGWWVTFGSGEWHGPFWEATAKMIATDLNRELTEKLAGLSAMAR